MGIFRGQGISVSLVVVGEGVMPSSSGSPVKCKDSAAELFCYSVYKNECNIMSNFCYISERKENLNKSFIREMENLI